MGACDKEEVGSLPGPPVGGTDTGGTTGNAFGICQSDDDCETGPCIPTPSGSVCSKSCGSDEDCPLVYTCRDSVCLSRQLNLCRPCTSDAECTIGGGPAGSRCVEPVPGEGLYCGVPSPCPAGYKCRTFPHGQGGELEQCIKDICPCSPRAIEEQASTTCGLGICAGTATCEGSGKPQCDGPEPNAVELCDGLDDDCDGETDEDFKAGDLYVHEAHCGGCDQPCSGQTFCAVVDGAPTCVSPGLLTVVARSAHISGPVEGAGLQVEAVLSWEPVLPPPSQGPRVDFILLPFGD